MNRLLGSVTFLPFLHHRPSSSVFSHPRPEGARSPGSPGSVAPWRPVGELIHGIHSSLRSSGGLKRRPKRNLAIPVPLGRRPGKRPRFTLQNHGDLIRELRGMCWVSFSPKLNHSADWDFFKILPHRPLKLYRKMIHMFIAFLNKSCNIKCA